MENKKGTAIHPGQKGLFELGRIPVIQDGGFFFRKSRLHWKICLGKVQCLFDFHEVSFSPVSDIGRCRGPSEVGREDSLDSLREIFPRVLSGSCLTRTIWL